MLSEIVVSQILEDLEAPKHFYVSNKTSPKGELNLSNFYTLKGLDHQRFVAVKTFSYVLDQYRSGALRDERLLGLLIDFAEEKDEILEKERWQRRDSQIDRRSVELALDQARQQGAYLAGKVCLGDMDFAVAKMGLKISIVGGG